MSLMHHVTRLVYEKGPVTVDDIAHLCPDHTRDQVLQALQNARQLRLIRRVALGKRGLEGGGRGSRPSTFGPIEGEQPPAGGLLRAPVREAHLKPRGKFGIGRVSSVFDLGA